MLFESTLAFPFSKQIKQKLRYPLDTGVLGGRGWTSRAALLKTAHWAVFALSSATAPQLFESTRAMSLALLQNKNLNALAYVEAFWWSEATQIRTIALWGIFGSDLIESDGFCAIFVVECNQNFFIIEINRVHERVDKRFPVAFHVRVELAEPGQPEPNLILTQPWPSDFFFGDPNLKFFLLGFQLFQT